MNRLVGVCARQLCGDFVATFICAALVAINIVMLPGTTMAANPDACCGQACSAIVPCACTGCPTCSSPGAGGRACTTP